MTNIGEKKVDILTKWEEKSRELIDAFLLLFGPDGRLTNIWNESKGRLMQALSQPPSPRSSPPPSENGDDSPEHRYCLLLTLSDNFFYSTVDEPCQHLSETF